MNDDFLRVIIEQPDRVSARLAFANHLDERGDPRGEFIRVQCELCRLSAGPGEGRENESAEWLGPDIINAEEFLRKRERELLREHEQAWAWPVRQWVGKARPENPVR